MKTNTDYITTYLAPYRPCLPLDQLIVEINQIYHAFEAQDYDLRHPEVHIQLPPLWHEMLSIADMERPIEQWSILDFGAGTGFEAEQILRCLPRTSIARLTCYDPSREMLERCKARVTPLFPDAIFSSDLEKILAEDARYNMLATNSLLHHLPVPFEIIEGLLPLLDSEAIWLAGHEPSRRFFNNRECMENYLRCAQEWRWRKYLIPSKYASALKTLIGVASYPAQSAAREAFRRGLFEVEPSPKSMNLLVDFHVAHSQEEAHIGRGFDFEEMEQSTNTWKLTWVRTYAHMGSFYEGGLTHKWARRYAELASKFPADGANFCSMWARI